MWVWSLQRERGCVRQAQSISSMATKIFGYLNVQHSEHLHTQELLVYNWVVIKVPRNYIYWYYRWPIPPPTKSHFNHCTHIHAYTHILDDFTELFSGISTL